MRASLGRLSTFESLWEAWSDPIRVLIRVLQLSGKMRLTCPCPRRSGLGGLGVVDASAAAARRRNRVRTFDCSRRRVRRPRRLTPTQAPAYGRHFHDLEWGHDVYTIGLADRIATVFRQRGRQTEDGGWALPAEDVIHAIYGPDPSPEEAASILIALGAMDLDFVDGEHVWRPRLTRRTSARERGVSARHGAPKPESDWLDASRPG
jgi:hypothetical protein